MIVRSIKVLFNLEQFSHESLAAYQKRFINARDLMETQYGKLEMKKFVLTLMEKIKNQKRNYYNKPTTNCWHTYFSMELAKQGQESLLKIWPTNML